MNYQQLKFEFVYNGIADSYTTLDNPQVYVGTFTETTTYEPFSVTDGNGCTTYYDDNITTITVHSLPEVVISGETEFCDGESTVLTASEGESYLWSTR